MLQTKRIYNRAVGSESDPKFQAKHNVLLKLHGAIRFAFAVMWNHARTFTCFSFFVVFTFTYMENRLKPEGTSNSTTQSVELIIGARVRTFLVIIKSGVKGWEIQ